MPKNFVSALLISSMVLISCSGGSDPDDPTCLVVDEIKSQGCDCCAIPDVLALSAPDFGEDNEMPLMNACDEADIGGGNQLPKLTWSLEDSPDDESSEDILSYAIIMTDGTEDAGELEVPSPSVDTRGFIHMILFNIPADVLTTENLGAEALFAINDNGETAYFGPCPPLGDGPHQYSFELYTLRVGDLTSLIGGSRATQTVYNAIVEQAVLDADVVGTFTHP